MRAYLIYESMFGNTEDIAEAIAKGLSESFDTTVVEVGQAPPQLPDGIDLLVIGGPTHAFGMSRPETRTEAARETTHPLVSTHAGIREWIDGLSGHQRPPFVTFSTKVRGPFPGSAGKSAQHHLLARGFPSAAAPEVFRVHGKTGPMVDGEIGRATDWGRRLGTSASSSGRLAQRRSQ